MPKKPEDSPWWQARFQAALARKDILSLCQLTKHWDLLALQAYAQGIFEGMVACFEPQPKRGLSPQEHLKYWEREAAKMPPRVRRQYLQGIRKGLATTLRV